MPHSIYKVLHLTGALMVFLSLGGTIVRSRLAEKNDATKKLTGITNGVGLLLSLVAGFGMLAKLGIGFEGWVMAKIIIWLIFGSLVAVINRKPEFSGQIWIVIIFLGVLAAYLGGVKPF